MLAVTQWLEAKTKVSQDRPVAGPASHPWGTHKTVSRLLPLPLESMSLSKIPPPLDPSQPLPIHTPPAPIPPSRMPKLFLSSEPRACPRIFLSFEPPSALDGRERLTSPLPPNDPGTL